MNIINDTNEFHSNGSSIALTIGNFDGVHLGHQAILNRMNEKSDQSVVLTFSNHPFEILQSKKTSLITTLSHKLSLFHRFGIHTTLLLPFTKSFSKQSAEEFLSRLRAHIPFSFLILGHDAKIGHQRSGNRSLLQQLSHKLDFELEYLEPVIIDAQPVSSSLIRKNIQKGNFEKVAALLGRRYSIVATVEAGAGKGKSIGFHTANIDVNGLCLPPFGVYVVELLHESVCHLGVANLGFAPTLHENRHPLLEIHLLDYSKDIYNEEIEVVFGEFLRPEKRFDSIQELKSRIYEDIQLARKWFSKTSDNFPDSPKT